MPNLQQNQSVKDTLRAGKVLTVTVTTGSVGVNIPTAAINETITASKSFGYFDKDVTIELSAFSGSVADYYFNDPEKQLQNVGKNENSGLVAENDVAILKNGFLPTYTGSIAACNGLADTFYTALRNIASTTVKKFDVRGNRLRLVFNTFQSGSSGDQDISGTCKIEGYATIRGVSYQAKWSGQSVLDGVYGQFYVSDWIELPFYFDEGEEWNPTVQALWTQGSGYYLCYKDSPQYFGYNGWASVYKNEGTWTPMSVVDGVVQLPSGGSWATTNDANYFGAYYDVCAVLGDTNKHTVAIFGDSRQKLGSSQRMNSCIKDKYGITGEVASYCAANNIPFINFGWSGWSYTNALTAGKFTKCPEFAQQYCTVLHDSLGVNDIGAGAAYSGTCTSTTSASMTGTSVTGATPAIGDFVEGSTLWPNTRVENVSGTTLTLSRAPISATTSFTLKRANTNTLSAWQNFIKQFRTFCNWWDKPYLHNTIFPRNLINGTTGARTASNATPTINYFNWLLRTGQLAAPIDRGDGVLQNLIDGFTDGAKALTQNGNTGVFKDPPQTASFTSSDGITTNTTAGTQSIVNSSAGSFKPWMNGHIIYIEGAGGSSSTNADSGSTTLRGYVNYLNANYIVLSLPAILQDATMTQSSFYNRSTATLYTRASAVATNANAYIHNGNYDVDGLHLAMNGEIEITKNGDFSQLNKYF